MSLRFYTVAVDSHDQMAEVGRLKALGARPLHLGGGPDAACFVLADPEANEFCVLSARD